MAQTDPQSMATMVAANDKLLKALITLLSLKDEHLLGELTTVFVYASETGAELGQAREATWKHVREELALIAELIGDEGASSVAPVLNS